MKQPTKTWIERYVRAAALNTLASRGAPIRVQQRFHTAYIKLRLEGERRWPHVDFASGLDSAIDQWLADHPFSGPGKDW